MAKVLITIIGTGNPINRSYKPALYKIGDKEYETEFIAKALVQHYQIDKIFMLGTAKSMWEEVYLSFSKEEDQDKMLSRAGKIEEKIKKGGYDKCLIDEGDLKLISNTIEEYLGYQGSKCYLLKYGLNDQEIMENFNVFLEIEKELNDGDEIYLDITHSFRSLAIFQYMMINFAENVSKKDIKIKGIFYGMLDVYGQILKILKKLYYY
ncbi:TIGR02221 family CRISPR-associated protein [Anaerobranca gottschalkii]|uniref:CRISPR-associated protein, TM1812 family n=1 Tax=Anaerobranca gottschalkii DSM 13577 TaxID=1120990 RepID=A0A1I0ABL7_9FIRM|nr:TIGR02221 family CRISPR-associated protein [Anaerobranca gottschalkii]SES91624.1 CRISPR-associated protein, TM1812 family [Anaerobranca gottschalkii DSM 13577]